MNEEHDLPDFDEASASQAPALLQLVNLGYGYLTRAEVRDLRESNSQYILREIAFEALRRLNSDNISDKSIRDAIFEVEQGIDMGGGAYRASETIFATLLAGEAVAEIIDGRRMSPQLKFIDFAEPSNNCFHACAEFELSEGQDRRPDIVLFVNGIPFAVIENKKEAVDVEEAVAQMVRNQGHGETPKFFLFPQLLVGTNVRELKYGTLLTPSRFYTHWKEKDTDPKKYDCEVSEVVNRPVAEKVVTAIAKDLLRGSFTQPQERSITEQDRGIHSLLRPERLLELARNFILYDNGVKKVARYQHYFGIKKTLQRLKTFDANGKRNGGLIWHTQGSGKSLTMVMLVKCLIEDPEIILPRVVIVTDRRDLDKQISDTFAACNVKKGVVRTSNSKQLLALIKEKDQRVITTLIHKFEASRGHRDFVDEDPNIFILIDEAHRSQAGKANIELNVALPKACQIGFTGTPLMKREKSSAQKFGGFIDTYTISEAEADGVVLPLVYQPRFAELDVQKERLDRLWDQITRDLSEEEKKDLQRKFGSSKIVEETSQRIETIAMDILEHYRPYRDTGLKAQVVAPSKYAAVMFAKAFELLGGGQGEVEVIISDTADKEEDDRLPEHKKVVAEWLKAEKHKHGTSLDLRERNLISDFKENPEGVRMLIVVDKLLTGFDAPRNTFLYLAKQLTDHNLLQAIARVNRLFEGDKGREAKANGHIIDYSKNAKNLRDAMQLFSNYDPEDIERALLNPEDKIAELEAVYQDLHTIFNSVRNHKDTEAHVRVLDDDFETSERFHELVNDFVKQMAGCQMLYDFPQRFGAEKLRRYQLDMKRFVELKKIHRAKHAEEVDFSKYVDQLRRALDQVVTAEEVQELAEPLVVSEALDFNAYIGAEELGLSDKSKAEAIAAQTQRTVKENYHRDPEFYRRFSLKIQELIEGLKAAREEDLRALLLQAKVLQEQVHAYEADDIPEGIRDRKQYHPYFRNLQARLEGHGIPDALLCELSVAMVDLVEAQKIVDWHRNVDVERRVRADLEDFLFDVAKGEHGIPLTVSEIDGMITMTWNLAKENRGS